MRITIQNVLALFDDSTLRQCSIYIESGKITSVDHAPEGFRAERTIDGRDRLLIPGLINAHTHSYMTVFRNWADDLKFHDWLFGKILPAEDKLTQEDCYWATQLGLMEMLSTGTTCLLDMYIRPNAAAEAVRDAGARAVLSRGLVGGEQSVGDRLLSAAIDEIQAWQNHENITFMLAPHAPYTCPPVYQREVAAAAKALGIGIHTHIAETRGEVEEIQEKYGKSPAVLMDEDGLLNEKTVAAHCVYLDDEDIALFTKRGASVAHNPTSNLKLACGIAPVPQMLASGVNVALGTDGSASNNSLNLFGDLRLSALLQKGTTGDPQAVTAREALRMATQNGAHALGLGDKIGKIAVGYQADLVLLDLSHPNMLPPNDPIAALVYSANGSEVVLTMVSGQIVYEDGHFPTIDTVRVRTEMERIVRRVLS